MVFLLFIFVFFKQKTAYELRISEWSSDVCSSDLIRILLGWMEGWSKGRKVTIAGVEVSDDGLVLRRSRFLKEDETRFFTWFEVSKGAHNGFLNFYGKSDKKFTTSFSYKDDWNVHIFDFAIDKIDCKRSV